MKGSRGMTELYSYFVVAEASIDATKKALLSEVERRGWRTDPIPCAPGGCRARAAR